MLLNFRPYSVSTYWELSVNELKLFGDRRITPRKVKLYKYSSEWGQSLEEGEGKESWND